MCKIIDFEEYRINKMLGREYVNRTVVRDTNEQLECSAKKMLDIIAKIIPNKLTIMVDK